MKTFSNKVKTGSLRYKNFEIKIFLKFNILEFFVKCKKVKRLIFIIMCFGKLKQNKKYFFGKGIKKNWVMSQQLFKNVGLFKNLILSIIQIKKPKKI